MKDQEYLYHYTSLETLALILKYKTIRFSRLDLVDDPEEIITKDYGNLGRFMYVSCWTDSKEESIPMWKMYSNNLKGIRIKLPKLPFKEYIINEYNESIIHNTNEHTSTTNHSKSFKCYLDPSHLGQHNYLATPVFEKLLCNINYTDDNNLLNPHIENIQHVDDNNFRISLDLSRLGKYKRKAWEFQKEVRYLFTATPWSKTELLQCKSHNDQLILFDRLKYNNLDRNYIDLNLDDEKLKDMEITLGPKSSEADKIIVDLLVKEFNPEAIIINSVIKII